MERLSILTCPDRPEYLGPTIDSIRRAGADRFDGDRVIYVDGPTEGIAHEGWRVERLAPGPLKTRKALVEIMRLAGRDGVDRLYYVEDDVAFCRNAIDLARRIEVPRRYAFVVLCDIKWVARDEGLAASPGWDAELGLPLAGHWGNQALIIPSWSLREMVEVDESEWTLEFASDLMISVVMAHEPASCSEYLTLCPSIAQHEGHRSLVSPGAKIVGWGRSARSFPGEDFDALSIDPAKLRVYPGWSPRGMTEVDQFLHRFHARGPTQVVGDLPVVLQRSPARG